MDNFLILFSYNREKEYFCYHKISIIYECGLPPAVCRRPPRRREPDGRGGAGAGGVPPHAEAGGVGWSRCLYGCSPCR